MVVVAAVCTRLYIIMLAGDDDKSRIYKCICMCACVRMYIKLEQKMNRLRVLSKNNHVAVVV